MVKINNSPNTVKRKFGGEQHLLYLPDAFHSWISQDTSKAFHFASDSSGVITSKKYAAVTGNEPFPVAVLSKA